MVATPPREAPWSSTFESGKKLLVIPHGTMRSLSKPHEVEEGTPRHPASQNRREGPLLLEPRDDGVRFSHFGITCNLATATFTITANLSSGGTAPFLLCTHARGVA